MNFATEMKLFSHWKYWIMNNKRIALLSILTGATVLGRIVMAPVPNVQPVTVILIFLSIYMGLADSLIVNALVIFISNMYLGFGPWTFYQILSYSIIIFLSFFLSKIKKFKNSMLLQTVFAAFSGILYGFIISIFTAAMFSKTSNFFVYYLNGLYFDIMHGIGNAVLYVLLIPPLKVALRKYKKL